MSRIHALFETERFYKDIDRIRQERHLYWPQVAVAVGFGLSWMYQPCRMQLNPRIDALVPLAAWAGLSLDTYIQVFDQAGDLQSFTTQGLTQIERSRRYPIAGKYSTSYDVERFYADLDQVRKARGLSWHGVWRLLPLSTVPASPSLCTFITQQIALSPKACDALATWANLDFSRYLKEASK